MPRLQATVPPGAPSNALLRVRLPDGAEVKVRVPDGLSEGDEFQFEVNALGEVKAVPNTVAATAAAGGGGKVKNKNPKKKRHHVDHHHKGATQLHNNQNNRTPLFISVCLDFYQNLIQFLTTEEDEEYNDTTNTDRSRGSRQKSTDKSSGSNNSDKTREVSNYLGFLDKDILNAGDFCLALAVGMFIGSCIVIGFLAGVLWVTPPGFFSHNRDAIWVNHREVRIG
ncbi:hypothetical protein ACHAWO_012455 [Cyclotella atomus]|uniref:Uncharacterized protein n=1 Tax=Cyclotella atomus TaxID=382360 RepID=A0ABD3PD22_9STRA